MGKRKKSGIKPFLIPTFIIIGIFISVVGGYILSIKTGVAKWEDKIYPGVTVNNIDVSGKTREEAIDILTTELQKINKKNVIVKANNKEFKLKLSDISPKYSIEESVDIALNTGKDEDLIKQNAWANEKNEKDIEAHCTYQSDKLDAFKDKVKKGVNTEPKNATIKKTGNNKFEVVEGKKGYTVNEEALNESLRKAVTEANLEDSEVNLTMQETEPKITKETLSKINGIIGSNSTRYNSYEVDRSHNLQLAVSACNGTVVMPGEVFSYNKTLGPRTPARGYKEAFVYTAGKVEKGVGGGICQVSSTLYRAAMRANLRSTERHNHMFTVSYADPGIDATVAWDSGLDYKFKNNYSSPIYIEAYLSGGMVCFNIYGNTEEKGKKTYEVVAGPTSSVKNGIKVSSYFVTYENGKQIKNEYIATDYYEKAPKH